MLLGQMHIQGKTDWQTYESAAYIYRRHKFHKVPAEEIAEEIRKSKSKVYQMIAAYEIDEQGLRLQLRQLELLRGLRLQQQNTDLTERTSQNWTTGSSN